MQSSLCVHELFALRAAETPEALAVAGPGLRLTYRELRRRADRLARRLVALGVGPEVPVAVLAGRSAEALVAILAVLKAGGCYLPLDPAYPEERLAWILADSGASVLLTQGPVPAGAAVRTLVLGEDGPDPEDGPELPRAGLENLAYVIYTSGSTGRPKGVEVEHRGLANLAAWHRRAYGITPAARATRLAGPAFDASVWEVWPYLTAGASLHIPEEGTVLSPDRLAEWLVREEITHAFLPTPLAEAVLAEPWPAEAPLKALLTGGDRLHRRPRPDHPFGLWNHYGPTESSVVTTWGRVEAEGDGAPSIGRPIDGIEVTLDERGEILIGGVGLARGYRGRPDLTAERFIPDEDGKRLYRTGDLARRLPSGELDFIGRADFQVKVRGFRIELGEIEVTLRRHEAVRDAVVLAWDGDLGEKRLAGYVVATATAGELREWLGRELPGYMVPTAWVFLDSLPLTPNGKVDRAALPAPEIGEDGYVAPGTDTEQRLAEIFAEVLEIPRVGASDDFFALGGHSLKASRVLSRVRRDLRVDLPPKALFDDPTVAGLARRVDASHREAGEGWEIRPVPRPNASEAELPVSFSQRGLWLADRLSPGTALYNTPFRLSLAGPLDVPSLGRALTEIVRRHEPLRTTFRARDNGPVQVVHPAAPVPLPVVDLSGLPAVVRAREAERIAAGEARRPFDLEQGPVLRLALLCLGEGEHALLALLHHIVSDDWSVWVFVSELSALYAAFSRGLPSPLPELPVRYGDFALWQRRRLEGEGIDGQLAWWRERLRTPLPVLDLPADHPRPAVRSFRGARLRRHLPGDLVEGLGALGRGADASLFIALLAAFDALLFRYTGAPEVLVGSPIANRHRVEVEGLIGVFVNTLVLPADLSGSPRFGELLSRVRETVLGAYAHQDLPFDRLVEELTPVRDLSRNPLADVFLILGNAPRPPRELAPGVRLGLAELETGVSKVDLSLFLEETEEGMAGTWEHSTDLFDSATVARMAGHLEVLVAGVVAAPGARIADLPLLSLEERAQLMLWNELTRHEPPESGLLHELFFAQAERSPEAVAVIDGVERFTYAELHDAVQALAREMRALGVGPEVAVGVCLERKVDLVISLLATLAAGGFYVPLDPAYPEERLAFMLEDSGARVIVAHAAHLDRLPPHDAKAIVLDAPAKVLGAQFIAPPPVIPGNLAYLIYTSGSTGRPKAVAIEHRSAALLVRWALRRFSPEELAGVLASTSIAFDLSVFEIFVPLAAGGAVILAENALALATLPARGEVTLVNTVPSAAAELLRMEALPPSVLTLNLAGEALPRALADRVHARPGLKLYNLYGPSEDTTYSTWAEIERTSRRTPPIGRPLDGTRTHVVDAGLHPRPVGVPGELLLGGGGLARGYLGRPELTAERLIPDPFGPEPGERLYRTGDLVRHLADGTLDYLGRLDHQVKVRGFRIELGEVEAALARLPEVEAAVVLAREDAALGLHLAACVVPRSGQEPDRAALKAALGERLPASMIPTAWAFLPELPLTSNGKVNRRALARLDVSAGPPGEAFLAPRSPVEEILAGLFAEVLGVGRVGLRDDFFALGGHSLLATRVLARVRQVLGVDLPVRGLFERPTVLGLAARVEELRREGRPEGPPLVPRQTSGPAPLSFSQERLWFLDRFDPGLGAYNLPLAVRLRGPLDPGALAAALGEVSRRHEALRTTFAEVAGEPVQVVSRLAPPPLPVVDLSGLPAPARAAEAEQRAREEARRPFDLRRGPLARWVLLALGSEEHVLLAAFHHIVSDGGSMGVLLSELSALYRGALLPALPVQMGDYAAWQRQWLSGDRLESLLARWRELLAGAPTTLELPADRPRPPVQSYRGAVQRQPLGDALAAGVEALSRRSGATPFMTLLAAFQTLLHRITGREDLLVGTPVANRNRAEIEGLIGLFVNTLALRGDLSGNPSFAELLERTREAALAAFSDADLPFEKLVEALAPERDLSRGPLVQVSFGLERAVADVPELAPGLQFTVEEPDLGTSKFDLTLVVEPGREGLEIVAEHSTDLFDSTTVRRLLGYYRALVEAAVARPEERLGSLPFLSEAERHQLLAEWNDTRSALPGRAAGTIAARPEALALIQGEESLTYGELESRVGALAARLRAQGVGPEAVVGILLERSFDLVVALLAVLRAGGAYLPLDPAYPEERIAFLLADSGAKHVVTRESLEAAGSTGILAGLRASSSESLAYVLYTSGSTGRPKGVGVPRSALAHHAEVMARRYGLGPGDRVLQFASVSFDVAAEEIFPTLLSGATLVLPPDPLGVAPERLSAFAERHGLTVLNLPSPYWHEWVDALAAGGRLPQSLRLVVAGSEAVSPEKLALWNRIAGGRVAWRNAYGLTETTVTATLSASVSVGAPIDNVRAHVLDGRGEPLPVGVPGELWLGGPGVARGYVGRPDLTAERFLPDRFAPAEPGARLFRTGDLARRRASGEIEILGRIDHQVKIRGFRIELGEVEAVIAAHPAVAAVVAVAREDHPGDRRLVAYVVPREELHPEALRDFVRERVPGHLVPAAFVRLDALPRTSQGKVDRAALPAPDTSRGSGFVPPRTPLEALVAEIWEAVLGIGQVGIDDSFWSLGGHSLLATRISSRLLEALGVEVPLQTLFEHPTLAGFAAAVGRLLLESRDEEVRSFLAEVEGLSVEQMEDLLRAESVELA